MRIGAFVVSIVGYSWVKGLDSLLEYNRAMMCCVVVFIFTLLYLRQEFIKFVNALDSNQEENGDNGTWIDVLSPAEKSQANVLSPTSEKKRLIASLNDDLLVLLFSSFLAFDELRNLDAALLFDSTRTCFLHCLRTVKPESLVNRPVNSIRTLEWIVERDLAVSKAPFAERLNMETILTDWKQNLLHFCANRNYFKILKWLVVQAGISIDTKSSNREEHGNKSILVLAICNKQNELVKYLCEQKEEMSLDVNSTDPKANGWSPMFYAIWQGNEVALKHLLELGMADPLVKDNHERTVMHYCCWYNRVECFKVLMSYPDFDLHLKDCAGLTPLYYACLHEDQSLVSLILSYDKNLAKSVDHNGRTILHFMSRDRNEAGIKTLLLSAQKSLDEKEIDDLVNARDNFNKSALRYALNAGSTPIAWLLAVDFNASTVDIPARGQ